MKYRCLVRNTKTGEFDVFDAELGDAQGWLDDLEKNGIYAIAMALEGPDSDPEFLEAMLTLAEKVNSGMKNT